MAKPAYLFSTLAGRLLLFRPVVGRWHVSAPESGEEPGGPAGAGTTGPGRTQLAWASRLRSVLTDKAYQGRFVQQVRALGWQHQVASRPPTAGRGFMPVDTRWVVEGTFAWFNYFRRVDMDYERQPTSHVAWLFVANLTMSLRRATSP